MKNLLAALVLLSSFCGTAHAALLDNWVGLEGGMQSKDGVRPGSYGLSLGHKGLIFGGELQYVTGTKSVSGGDQTISQVVGRFDVFPLLKLLYVGPQLSYVAQNSNSGLFYGAAAGFNIPLILLSLGAEASYVKGTINGSDTHLTSVLATLKLWF